MNKSALFSDCRKYRYWLLREWDTDKPKIMFIGLNPSTANETDDDPTIRRVIGFAKDWGYGGVYMMNLFAICSSDPSILKSCEDPIGKNDYWLYTIRKECKRVLFAWGNFKEAVERSSFVSSKFTGAICLGFNKNGTPKHPLYVSANTLPINFIGNGIR
jgi:hypothetical protein